MTANLPIGTELRITSTGGEHFFPVGALVSVTRNSDPECPLLVGEYLATTLDPFADNDWEEGVTAYVLTSGEDKNAEVTGGEMIRDPATIRATWEDDADRIIRRVHAALNSGTDKAVVAVVLDETDKARAEVDELRASVTEYEASLQAAQSRLAISEAEKTAILGQVHHACRLLRIGGDLGPAATVRAQVARWPDFVEVAP